MLKRVLYLGYYLRETDKGKFRKFIAHASKASGRSRLSLLVDGIASSLRYNISILDYFYFRFYDLTPAERSEYAGTGFMYEFQLKMNPRGAREILENKIAFLNAYKEYVNRSFASLDQLLADESLLSSFLQPGKKLVLKGSRGQVGAEVRVVACDDFTPESLVQFMRKNKLDLVENFVIQHPDLMRLSPSGLNTVRIFTQIDNGKLVYLGARLRITINSVVDNMAAGNIAAPVDLYTGKVIGAGVFSDITKEEIAIHPVTGENIIGFQIPFWRETLEMLEKAVFLAPQNRSVGWDIAISSQGPELIEGNHNWCKLLWQLPVKRGLKDLLKKYI